MTAWTRPCAYCGVPFTAPAAHDHCSPRCRDLHRWYGVVPDAHCAYAARVQSNR